MLLFHLTLDRVSPKQVLCIAVFRLITINDKFLFNLQSKRKADRCTKDPDSHTPLMLFRL